MLRALFYVILRLVDHHWVFFFEQPFFPPLPIHESIPPPHGLDAYTKADAQAAG